MFGNGKKTIGVFINRSELEFQQEIMKGIASEAAAHDYNVAFMNSYGIRESQKLYDVYESAIVHFAPMEEFDAIIVALDTYDTPMLRTRLLQALQERAGCPIVSFREENQKFYNVLAKANHAVAEIIAHFIEKHGRHHLAFMAGYVGHVDSELRLRSFLQEMKRRKLPLYKNSVFHGDMWKLKGEEAYRFFFEGAGEKPDAVICANDYMARALCDALEEHGIRVPEDVIVSGFDNVLEAKRYEPSLTTVAVDYEKMAIEAIRLVDSLLKGEKREQYLYVPAVLKYRESCGCVMNSEKHSGKKRYIRQLDTFMDRNTLQTYFSIDMGGCSDFQEMYRIIGDHLMLLHNYSNCYLCLFQQKDENGYPMFTGDLTEKAVLKMGYKNGKRLETAELVFEQRKLLPPELTGDGPQIYHITLLHNRHKCFGYTAVSYQDAKETSDVFFHNWNLTISLTINELCTRENMKSLIQKNEEASVTDYLTGLLNRRGIEELVQKHWQEWVTQGIELTFFSIDLDRLKYINDTFGHREGDCAICMVADAIRNLAGARSIAARTGGDEFVVVMETEKNQRAGEFERQLEQYLEQANCRITEYEVSASVGSYTTTPDGNETYDDCVRRSDERLYQIKNLRKKGRETR